MSHNGLPGTQTPLVKRTLHGALCILQNIEPGECIPGEVAFAHELSVSRTTVREANAWLKKKKIVRQNGRRLVLARNVRQTDFPKDIPEELPKDREVVHHLLEQIGTGKILPGQRFSERQLASELGCSTAPVREAMLSLVPLGLFRKEARRQWQAVELNECQIRELTELRQLVECYCLGCLMREETLGRYRSRLKALLKRTKALGTKAGFSMSKFSELDVTFHRMLLESSGNRIIAERHAFIYTLVEFQLHSKRFTVERARLGVRQHIGIIEAILSGHEDEAQKLLKEHLNTAMDAIISLTQ